MRLSKKSRKRSATYMLAPRWSWLLKVYCDVRKSWFLAWNQKRHNMYYIFHIQYNNSEISIGLFYIRSHFVWWHRLNHCAALVRHLLASILVRASVSLRSTILAPFWFTNFEWDLSGAAEQIIEPFHSTLLNEAIEQHWRLSVAV